jgi:hypothetical protein
MSADRVLLHVGAPKTGTTFLQSVLWKNRAALADAGVCYPLRRRTDHFAATMDLRQLAWGGQRRPEWQGGWERMAERVRAWSGPTAVISNELLGGATPKQVASALTSLRPADVHVVVTARDLGRQLPSDWQEQLKHRSTIRLADFVAACVEGGQRSGTGRAFWRLHDIAAVLRRWGKTLAPDRLHVVTVPPRGAPPGLLWERFATLLDVVPDAYDTDVPKPNPSLGVVECELLRRLNGRLAETLGSHYDAVARLVLAGTVLAQRGSPPPLLPAAWRPEVAARSQQLVDQLRARGCHVVGDLAELVPGPAGSGPGPGAADQSGDALLSCTVDAVAGLLVELPRFRRRAEVAARRPAAPATPR